MSRSGKLRDAGGRVWQEIKSRHAISNEVASDLARLIEPLMEEIERMEKSHTAAEADPQEMIKYLSQRILPCSKDASYAEHKTMLGRIIDELRSGYVCTTRPTPRTLLNEARDIIVALTAPNKGTSCVRCYATHGVLEDCPRDRALNWLVTMADAESKAK